MKHATRRTSRLYHCTITYKVLPYPLNKTTPTEMTQRIKYTYIILLLIKLIMTMQLNPIYLNTTSW